MKIEEKNNFIQMIIVANEGSMGKELSAEGIEWYWLNLMDMPFELIKKRIMIHTKTNKWFPSIAEIRQEKTAEDIAQEEYKIMEDLSRKFIFDGFQQTGRTIVEQKLKKSGRDYLIPIFNRWGSELLTSNNPTATRAQCLKQITAEIKTEPEKFIRLEDKKQKQLQSNKRFLPKWKEDDDYISYDKCECGGDIKRYYNINGDVKYQCDNCNKLHNPEIKQYNIKGIIDGINKYK